MRVLCGLRCGSAGAQPHALRPCLRLCTPLARLSSTLPAPLLALTAQVGTKATETCKPTAKLTLRRAMAGTCSNHLATGPCAMWMCQPPSAWY